MEKERWGKNGGKRKRKGTLGGGGGLRRNTNWDWKGVEKMWGRGK